MQESVIIKNLDHLELVATMIDELEIEKSVDNEILADTNKKRLSYGTLVKAMILNGLGYVNKQLYLTPQFFKDKPLETLFSQTIGAEQINDDALGRTLDAIYNYGVSELYEKIAYKAIYDSNGSNAYAIAIENSDRVTVAGNYSYSFSIYALARYINEYKNGVTPSLIMYLLH